MTLKQPPSHIAILAGYWAAGFMLAGTYMQDDLFRIQDFAPDWPWLYRLLASLALVGIDTYIYHRSCIAKDRPLDMSTLVIFPIVNGVAETAIFLSAFKVGEKLVAHRTENLWWCFLGGMVPYFTFVTLIHVFMWIRILPDHLNDSPKAKFYRRLLVPSKSVLATSWAILYFVFRDAWIVIALHTLVDVGLVVSLRYCLWD